MTPPNELEKLAEFQDAIQSNKGLERLRAMQYLQQMNNQGIMGLPQVQQQPIVQRENGGKVFNNLDEATAANLPPNSKFFIVDDPDPYFVDSTGAIGKEVQEGITGGIDAYTEEDIKDGTVSVKEAIAHNNYLRNLEQSNQNRSQYNRRIDVEKHGDMGVQSRAYGGAIGTGGLVGRTDNGLGIWNRTEEGTMNKGIYGGIYEGDSESTATATSPSSTSATPGTLASGIAGPTNFNIEDGMADQYGNTIGDFSGLANYYDLNKAALDAGQNTFMYGAKLMQVDPGFQQGMSTKGKNFISNATPYAGQMTGSGASGQVSIGDYQEAPYLPTAGFNQDISRDYDSYYDANLAAKDAGSPGFIWGSKLAKTDPGLLPDYQESDEFNEYSDDGLKPFISNKVPEQLIDYANTLPPHMNIHNAPRPDGFGAEGQKYYVGSGTYSDTPPVEQTGRAFGSGGYKHGGYIMNRADGGLIDLPIRGASRLADEVNYVEEVDPINLPQPIMANQGGYVLDLASGGPIDPAEAAQGLASFGRHGDSMLIHMNPEEVQGLMSLGKLTRNPITGLPEAFSFGNIFKPFKQAAKSIKKVVRSKTFRALAPLVLAVAAPYALGALAPSVFGAGSAATMFGGALSTSSALGYGVATGLGSLVGNLLGGAKFGDAAKQGLLSGATAGVFKGIGSGNWMGPGNTAAANAANAASNTASGNLIKQSNTLGSYGSSQAPVHSLAGQNVVKAPIGQNILADASQNPIWGASARGPATAANQFNIPQGSVTGLEQTSSEFIVPEGVRGAGSPLGNVDLSKQVIDIGAINPATGEKLPPLSGFKDYNLTRPDINIPTVSADQAAQLAREPFTLSQQVGQIGRNIYKDYGNLKGAAKLVGMDAMQPDWDQVYASEESMEQQLQDMGYTIDTGFDGQRVIRDSSGVTLPSNLSVQDILDRALGRTPRTRLADKIGFEPNATAFSAQGGLVSLARGGEFSGMVEGDGHGMEDNVYMPIKERGHGKQIGTLAVSPSEYVVDAHTMSALGNGNPDAGAKVMDNVIASVRKKAYGTTQQPNEINGLNALMPMMQGV